MTNRHGSEGNGTGFTRLPGLFRRWELADLIEVETEFYVERAGESEDGVPLFALFERDLDLQPQRKEATR
jgi:hypothetical protein